MTEEFDLLDDKKPGRRNYQAILVRRRWYLIAPLLACGLAGSLIARLWHLQYRSEALILVEQQKVPEQYVTPNVITNLQDRLDALRQQILSRTRLAALIEQFNLYARERARLTADEVIDTFRKNIAVELAQARGRQGDVTAFRISYSAYSARTAQRITDALTSLFIEGSMRERTEQSTATTQFLESQLAEAQKELAAQEEKLSRYKMQFLSELPEQETSNLQILSSLEAQLYASEGARQRAQQQKTYLESLKAQYETMTARPGEEPTLLAAADIGRNPELENIDIILSGLLKQLSEAQSKYGPQHPDLVQLEGQVAAWQQTKREVEARIAAKAAHAARKPSGSPQTSVVTQMNIVEIDSRLKATDIEIENQQKAIADIQSRIRGVQSLLQKKLQSELASNLELRQKGEKLRILDPASLPEKPEGRLSILCGGWIVGLGLGLGLVMLREFASGSVNDDADITSTTPAPIFRIPVIRTPRELRRLRLRLAWEVLSGLLLLLAAAGATAGAWLMS